MNKIASGFIVHPYRMHRLDDFCTRMSSDRETVMFDPNVAAALKAQGLSWTETPRSIYRVDKLYEALSKYAPGRVPDVHHSKHLEHGIALARACFAKPKDHPYLIALPLDFHTVVYVTSNPTGSAGLTAWGVKKEDAMLRALERGEQILKGEKRPEPCISFARTQFNDKTRLVWGYPYTMTVIEGLIAKPLIERFRGSSITPMAFGMSSHKLGSKLRVAARHHRYAYSIDMSSYDASISADLIHASFGILRTWFDLNSVEPTTGVKLGKIFELIENYFIHTPIVMPDHCVYYGKKHGVPSGSYFTQIIDSIANVIIAGTLSSRFNLNLYRREMFVLGDDLLFWTNRNISLETLASFATSQFSVQFNATKSEKFTWDQPIKYLGRIWDHGIPDQALDEIVARMVYPERFRHYSSEPNQRIREVRLLLASFCASYKSANHILKMHLGGHPNGRIAPEADDIKVFRHNDIPDAEMLSGLMRFNLKYLEEPVKGHRAPTSIARMWVS